MRYWRLVAVFAVLLSFLAMAILFAKFDPSSPDNRAHRKAVYIRTHNCKLEGHKPPAKRFDPIEAKDVDDWGYSYYSCPNADQWILIWDNEEKP